MLLVPLQIYLGGVHMPLFGNRHNDGRGGGLESVQPPDVFGERGQLAYGSQRFESALEDFNQAIDKLHTMYVMGNCTHRTPSDRDNYILDGFVNALGVVKSDGKDTGHSESSMNYLVQIAEVATRVGADASPYISAARQAEFELGR